MNYDTFFTILIWPYLQSVEVLKAIFDTTELAALTDPNQRFLYKTKQVVSITIFALLFAIGAWAVSTSYRSASWDSVALATFVMYISPVVAIAVILIWNELPGDSVVPKLLRNIISYAIFIFLTHISLGGFVAGLVMLI